MKRFRGVIGVTACCIVLGFRICVAEHEAPPDIGSASCHRPPEELYVSSSSPAVAAKDHVLDGGPELQTSVPTKEGFVDLLTIEEAIKKVLAEQAKRSSANSGTSPPATYGDSPSNHIALPTVQNTECHCNHSAAPFSVQTCILLSIISFVGGVVACAASIRSLFPKQATSIIDTIVDSLDLSEELSDSEGAEASHWGRLADTEAKSDPAESELTYDEIRQASRRKSHTTTANESLDSTIRDLRCGGDSRGSPPAWKCRLQFHKREDSYPTSLSGLATAGGTAVQANESYSSSGKTSPAVSFSKMNPAFEIDLDELSVLSDTCSDEERKVPMADLVNTEMRQAVQKLQEPELQARFVAVREECADILKELKLRIQDNRLPSDENLSKVGSVLPDQPDDATRTVSSEGKTDIEMNPIAVAVERLSSFLTSVNEEFVFPASRVTAMIHCSNAVLEQDGLDLLSESKRNSPQSAEVAQSIIERLVPHIWGI